MYPPRGRLRRSVPNARSTPSRSAPVPAVRGCGFTSNRSSASTRNVRRAADGSGASGAIEPLAASGSELPSGVTKLSGGGPSHGPSTRASCPRRRSSRARPSTWAWTPPGTVRLYGHTIPTRSIPGLVALTFDRLRSRGSLGQLGWKRHERFRDRGLSASPQRAGQFGRLGSPHRFTPVPDELCHGCVTHDREPTASRRHRSRQRPAPTLR
jgi:hypothetical protein